MEQRVYCAISPRHLLALNWRSSSSSSGSGNGVEQLEGQRRRAAAGMAAMSSVAVTRALYVLLTFPLLL
jgi:hypothetical protein